MKCKCGERIGFFAYLFGIRICEDCDMKPLKDLIKFKELEIDRRIKELGRRWKYPEAHPMFSRPDGAEVEQPPVRGCCKNKEELK